MKTLMFFLFLICCGALTGCSELAEQAVKSQQRYFVGERGRCSMTIINKAYAITAAHCLPLLATPFGVITGKDSIYLEDGRVLEIESYNMRLDVALLKGDFKEYEPLPVDFTKGQLFSVRYAHVCGYPGESRVLRCEKVRRVRNEVFQACFQTTIIPGQSGGGVFSLNGTLIGVVQRVTNDGLSCFNTVTGMVKN